MIYFWYRQSPRLLVAGQVIDTAVHPRDQPHAGLVSPRNPPPTVPGMVSLRLAPDGRLLRLEAVPTGGAAGPSERPPGSDPPWTALFREAGLDLAGDRRWEEVNGDWAPPVVHDAKGRWRARGIYPGRPDSEVWAEAAAYRGKPVYFRLRGEWSRDEVGEGPPIGVLVAIVGIALLLAAVLLAARNWSRGRGDLRGALRLALFMFVVRMLMWLLQTHHVASQWEASIFAQGVSLSLWDAALVWLAYVALEPFARRLWPEALISWSRLLAGRFRDPMVGRDLLVGCVSATVLFLLVQLLSLTPRLIGLPPPSFLDPPSSTLGGLEAGQWPAQVLEVSHASVGTSLFGIFLLFVVLRLVFRRDSLAVAAILIFRSVLLVVNEPTAPFTWVAGGLLTVLSLFTLLRFGLLALTFQIFILFLLIAHDALTSRLSAWYAGPGLWTVGLILALAGYGCYVALGGRPLLGKGWLGDEDT